MNIRFANQETKEYAHGASVHFKNDGKAFEVKDLILADELLHAKQYLGGAMVNVFEPAIGDDRVEPAESAASGYPDEFPGAEALIAAGLSHDEVVLLNREQLLEIKGIGAKTADAIVAATTPVDASGDPEKVEEN